MKLIFSDITIGGGPNWFLEAWKGVEDVEVEDIFNAVPRSDYTESISDYLPRKIRSFDIRLVGNDVLDFRDKKRMIMNKIRQSFVFTLVDDIVNADRSVATYEVYEFSGKIISIKPYSESRSNTCGIQIQIACDDPFLYLPNFISKSVQVSQAGFIFPMIFPLVFSSSSSNIVLDNTGEATVYPEITITGPGSNFTIINETTDPSLIDKYFTYTGSLTAGDELVISSNPKNPIKVRRNGVVADAQTNFNFDALKLIKGINSFTFLVGSGQTAATIATLEFKPAFNSI